MSKIAQYLNEHLVGETSTQPALRKLYANDASILTLTPDIVAYPALTSDIRKILRFSYQLASKGHVVSVTPRGYGNDETGAAISDGIVVDTTVHMNKIFEFDAKQSLIRLQPGVTMRALNDALGIQGFKIGDASMRSTIGGEIANSALPLDGTSIADTVQELEVVLANGDVLQTGRISKREFNKKQGLQGFEGEVYRGIKNLLEDYSDTIAKIDTTTLNSYGHPGIAHVLQKNGSIDLTPLFIGSQGTLGVISEMILKATYRVEEEKVAAFAFGSIQELNDAVDEIMKLAPLSVQLLSGEVLARAFAEGKRYTFIDEAKKAINDVAGVVVCTLNDSSSRTQIRKLKKLRKIATKFSAFYTDAVEVDANMQLKAVENAPYVAFELADTSEVAYPPLISDFYLPHNRFEEFVAELDKVSGAFKKKYALYGRIDRNTYTLRAPFSLRSVTDKQNMLKMIDTLTALIDNHGGASVSGSGEGRIRSMFAHKQQDPEIAEVYEKIRNIFDPYNTLNNGVKQPGDLRKIVSQLRSSYDKNKA